MAATQAAIAAVDNQPRNLSAPVTTKRPITACCADMIIITTMIGTAMTPLITAAQ